MTPRVESLTCKIKQNYFIPLQSYLFSILSSLSLVMYIFAMKMQQLRNHCLLLLA